MNIENIYKRDFTKKAFQLEKITDAILKSMMSVNKGDVKSAESISSEIYKTLIKRKKN
jgi:ribonucleoside-diphosphate reductase beta chain